MIGLMLSPELLFSSAKTRELQQLLPRLKEDGHRTLIFSQVRKGKGFYVHI